MIALINRVTGTTMFVADDRVTEYLANGHKLAVDVTKPAQKKDGKPQPKKTVKKTTAKKK